MNHSHTTTGDGVAPITPEDNAVERVLFHDVDKEFARTLRLADRLLDEPYADPDDDLRTLARQFLRAVERSDPRCSGCYEKGWHFKECTGVTRYTPDASKQQNVNGDQAPTEGIINTI